MNGYSCCVFTEATGDMTESETKEKGKCPDRQIDDIIEETKRFKTNLISL